LTKLIFQEPIMVLYSLDFHQTYDMYPIFCQLIDYMTKNLSSQNFHH